MRMCYRDLYEDVCYGCASFKYTQTSLVEGHIRNTKVKALAKSILTELLATSVIDTFQYCFIAHVSEEITLQSCVILHLFDMFLLRQINQMAQYYCNAKYIKNMLTIFIKSWWAFAISKRNGDVSNPLEKNIVPQFMVFLFIWNKHEILFTGAIKRIYMITYKIYW